MDGAPICRGHSAPSRMLPWAVWHAASRALRLLPRNRGRLLDAHGLTWYDDARERFNSGALPSCVAMMVISTIDWLSRPARHRFTPHSRERKETHDCTAKLDARDLR